MSQGVGSGGSAAPITQSGETLWCCFDYPELSCPVRSLLLREAARFLVRGLPFFCLFSVNLVCAQA